MSTTTNKATASKTTRKPRKTASQTTAPSAPVAAPLSALDGSPPAPASKPDAAPSVVAAAQAVILGPVMRKKELIDAVVTHSGLKKKDVKPIVESTLEVLAKALAEKRELNLQPLGRVMIRREKQVRNGRVLVAKIRQSDGGPGPDAKDDEGAVNVDTME